MVDDESLIWKRWLVCKSSTSVVRPVALRARLYSLLHSQRRYEEKGMEPGAEGLLGLAGFYYFGMGPADLLLAACFLL